MKEIAKVVAEYYDIPVENLGSRCRKRDISLARMMAMYFGRRMTGLSLQAIASHFNRDHATALHAIKTIKNDAKYIEKVQQDIKALAILLRTTSIEIGVRHNYVLNLGRDNQESKFEALKAFCDQHEITLK